MKIAKYVQSLLPRIERKDVSTNLEDLRAELRDSTLPPYKTASDMLNNWTFKDKFDQALEQNFSKQVQSQFHGNFVQVIYQILAQTMDNITEIEKLVDALYSKDIIASSLTYSETQLLQLIEAISWATRYARKLLIYVLGAETGLYRQMDLVGKEMPPAEIKWLQNNYMTFFVCLRAMNHSPDQMAQIFQQIPNVTVDADNAQNVAASVGAKNLDPLQLGSYGLILNPIYHLRIAYTNWQVARYDAAKEERKMLEYQILDLKNAMANKNDPKLEQALEYTQDRVNKLNFKIQKMEEGS